MGAYGVLFDKVLVHTDAERTLWQPPAQRKEAVGGLVERWQVEEQKLQDKQDQRDTDERAQRIRRSLNN